MYKHTHTYIYITYLSLYTYILTPSDEFQRCDDPVVRAPVLELLDAHVYIYICINTHTHIYIYIYIYVYIYLYIYMYHYLSLYTYILTPSDEFQRCDDPGVRTPVL